MPADNLSLVPDPDTEKNLSETGQNGTFGDIDPTYQLSDTQCRAIELALAGYRPSQIARSLNLTRKTLWRWKSQDPDFQQALADARADRQYFAIERCQALASRATSVLANFLDGPDDKLRLRAAHLLLQAAARFTTQRSRSSPSDSPADDGAYWPPPDLPPKVG